VLLHCTIFSAICLTMPLQNKLLENCIVQQKLSCNVFLCATLSTALHKVEFKSTFHNALQQLVAPLHRISTLQQLSSQFLIQVLYRRMHEFIILLWNDLGMRHFQLTSVKNIENCWERLHGGTGPSNLFRNGAARQAAEKIAQCNSTLSMKKTWENFIIYNK